MTRLTMRLLAAVLAVTLLLTLSALGGCSSSVETTTTAPVSTTTAVTTTTYAPQDGTLTASELIVRDGPGFDHDSIGGMTKGDEFTIVGHEGDWYKITFGDGYGYIVAAFVDVAGQPNASQMIAEFTTVSHAATTSRTKPQSPTTKPVATTATAAAANTTAAANGAAVTTATPVNYIPDTAINDNF